MKTIIYITIVFSLSFLNNASAQVNLTQGLVAYYPFNDNANDHTVNAFNGTLMNSPLLTTDLLGRPTAAYKFNGTNTYIQVSDVLDSVFAKSPNAAFSVTGWANTRMLSTIQGDNVMIAKSSGGASGPYQWYIVHENDGKVKGLVSYSSLANDNFIERQSTSTIPDSTWFNFIMIYDGSITVDTMRLKFYVNGEGSTVSRKVGTGGTRTVNSSQKITIGGTYSGMNTPVNIFDGVLDEIRIYNRALTNDEVQALQTYSTVFRTQVATIDESLNRKIYPNPSSSGIFVLENFNESTVNVFNSIGQLIQTCNGENIKIDLSGQHKGVYFVTILENGKTQIQKLIYE